MKFVVVDGNFRLKWKNKILEPELSQLLQLIKSNFINATDNITALKQEDHSKLIDE